MRVAMRSPAARKTPLYNVVDTKIRRHLIENVWKPGTMLPSEMQLARDLNVSHGTARRALDALVAEGLLVRRHGVGTFVSSATDRRELYLYFNLIPANGAREMSQSRCLSSLCAPSTAREAARLEIAAGARVIRMKRLRHLSERPVIVETIVVPESFFAGLTDDGAPPEHLFRHYESRYGVTVTHADEHLTAKAATKTDAKLLGIAPGAPLLNIDRIAYRLDAKPVEWRRSLCNTAQHRYEVRRGSATDARD